MKKNKNILKLAISILSLLSICACSQRIMGAYFSKEKLDSYSISELPPPPGETMLIDDDLVLFSSGDDFGDYSKSIYQYLSSLEIYYFGTYENGGLIAEMFPNYIYEPIDQSYDFSKDEHHFVYSTRKKLNDGIIDPCFEISLYHFEKRRLPFSFFKYDSSIKLNSSIFVSVANDENG